MKHAVVLSVLLMIPIFLNASPQVTIEKIEAEAKKKQAAQERQERLMQACIDRRFRIAPLPVDLIQPKPDVAKCSLPFHEAFQGDCEILDVVAMPDRYCWGVLIVSARKDWLKIKFGAYIPVVIVGAIYADDGGTKWRIKEPKA